jgi:hypothetical protein
MVTEPPGNVRVRSMPPKNRPVSRYSLQECCIRIVKAMGRSRPKVLRKRLAAELEMDEGTFSHKIRNTPKSSFTIEEIGLVADWFNAPAGWPFIDADVRKEP